LRLNFLGQPRRCLTDALATPIAQFDGSILELDRRVVGINVSGAALQEKAERLISHTLFHNFCHNAGQDGRATGYFSTFTGA
jgi:hypothetical protein